MADSKEADRQAENERQDIAREKHTQIARQTPALPQNLGGWLSFARRLPDILPWTKKKTEIRKAVEEIIFKPNGFLTLGVEVEFNLIDPASGGLVQRADEFLAKGALNKKLHAEYFQSMAEVTTGICHNVHDAARDLAESFTGLSAVADDMNMGLVTTARHPTADDHDNKITNLPRYTQLASRMHWMRQRMIVGMHVHVGMRGHHDAIRFNNFYMHFIPHIIALSASSPFWQGEDTGLVSSRPTAYEAIPTSGQPYPLHNWAEFEELYWSLRACGAITSLKDLWWDVRPSPKYGTLEIRAADGVATLEETLAIVAFIHLLGHWFTDHLDWLDQVARPPNWVARENKWRAMREGLRADLVVTAAGKTRPMITDIEDWLIKLQPYAEALGYHAYMETLRKICQLGNSAERQRQVYAKTKSFEAVALFNLREFRARAPLWDEVTYIPPQLAKPKPPEKAAEKAAEKTAEKPPENLPETA